MEESASSDAYAGIDDVIISVHTNGETVFQAMDRAISLGADRYDPALLTEVPEGRVPVPGGRPLSCRGSMQPASRGSAPSRSSKPPTKPSEFSWPSRARRANREFKLGDCGPP